jgi:hypothetical protein
VVTAATVLLLVPGVASAQPAASGRVHLQDEEEYTVTLYGWPDNDPPGDDIAYPQIHDSADGTGTYDDPVTMAAPYETEGGLEPGTIVYVPYMKKYFIMEDECAEGCVTEQIDLWAGGSDDTADEVLECEDSLTRDSAKIIIDPDEDLEVDETPIFDDDSGECYEADD